MMTCKIDGCDSTELVYSGVDAFLLGCNTEEICYTHANQYAKENN